MRATCPCGAVLPTDPIATVGFPGKNPVTIGAPGGKALWRNVCGDCANEISEAFENPIVQHYVIDLIELLVNSSIGLLRVTNRTAEKIPKTAKPSTPPPKGDLQ